MENTYRLNKEIAMGKDAPMYIYATEMVGTYYKLLCLKGKRVLTICGSGDQAINAYFFGADNVVAFDLNENCRHILDLKLAATQALNRKEFLGYFGEKTVNVGFGHREYAKIKKFLSPGSRAFFDRIYREFGNDGNKLAKSYYFRQRDDISKIPIIKINPYLRDEVSYEKIKKILKKKKIIFIYSDVKEISKFEDKFDIINLSNVPNYFVGHLEVKSPLEFFYSNVLLKIKGLLSGNGLIFFYSYSDKVYPNRIASKIPIISKKSSLESLKKKRGFKVTQKEFDGLTRNTKDRITLLRA